MLAEIWCIYRAYFCTQASCSPAKATFCLWRRTLFSGQLAPPRLWLSAAYFHAL